MSLYQSDPAVPPLRIRSWRSVRAAWRRGTLNEHGTPSDAFHDTLQLIGMTDR